MQLPITDSAIVLDVGSGGNPHPRADVLIDRLSGAAHRGGDPMLIDRPAIIGDATKLPFKDKSFDYVIASHVLEHMSDPEIFLSELQRVSKAGYIETPNFICERLIPSRAHCLEIGVTDNTLQIHKKSSFNIDPFFSELSFLQKNDKWSKIYFNDPELFHVQYFWNSGISYKIFNPDASCDWIQDVYKNSIEKKEIVAYQDARVGWRSIGSKIYESMQKFKRKSRLKNFNLYDVIACPECKGNLNKVKDELHCQECKLTFATIPHINFENPIS
jgi:SAM-dependent methyltransferase